MGEHGAVALTDDGVARGVKAVPARGVEAVPGLERAQQLLHKCYVVVACRPVAAAIQLQRGARGVRRVAGGARQACAVVACRADVPSRIPAGVLHRVDAPRVNHEVAGGQSLALVGMGGCKVAAAAALAVEAEQQRARCGSTGESRRRKPNGSVAAAEGRLIDHSYGQFGDPRGRCMAGMVLLPAKAAGGGLHRPR
eukprot:scaffold70378_cov61-Phaeocystis_antarctica.AAC.1